MTERQRPFADDPIVRRAVDELRVLPPVDADAVQRVVAAAALARVTPAAEDEQLARPRRWRGILIGTAGVAAAALVAAVVSMRIARRPAAPSASQIPAPVVAALRSASLGDGEVLPVPQQFVLTEARAHRVSVVGDFNGWNAAAAPMTRSPDGRLWSTTILVPPGRHMYAFMVDDSLMLAPGQPTARDPDLGVEASVMIAGRP
jgi:hypothetical protein